MAKPQNRGNNRRPLPPVETRFQKGKSGNPGGRPKRRPITERYAILIESVCPEQIRKQLNLPPGSTWGDAMVVGQMRSAVTGNTSAMREMRESIEGKSTTRIELTPEGGKGAKQETSVADTLAKIREIYGLDPSPQPNPQVATDVQPLPEAVDQRPIAEKVSPKV